MARAAIAAHPKNVVEFTAPSNELQRLTLHIGQFNSNAKCLLHRHLRTFSSYARYALSPLPGSPYESSAASLATPPASEPLERIFSRSSAVTCGFSCRNARAFSLPCPKYVSPYLNQAPLRLSTFWFRPRSRISPS